MYLHDNATFRPAAQDEIIEILLHNLYALLKINFLDRALRLSGLQKGNLDKVML